MPAKARNLKLLDQKGGQPRKSLAVPSELFISFNSMPLEGPDQLHLRAAVGYIELAMFEEANTELEEIDPFCRHLPAVLLARLAIYHGLEKWELLSVVAKKRRNGIRKSLPFSLNLPMQPDALNRFTPPTRS